MKGYLLPWLKVATYKEKAGPKARSSTEFIPPSLLSLKCLLYAPWDHGDVIYNRTLRLHTSVSGLLATT